MIMAKMVEQCLVSPPPATVATTVLPLTYFDVLWIYLCPVKRLFFYECAGITTAGFLSSHLPDLRRSLSLTLQLFFSLAGRLSVEHLVIEYADGDSVPLLVAESADGDFASLMSDEPKDMKLLHPLLPPLPPSDERGRRPLLALQLTVFPGAGFSLGLTFHHVAADGNSIHRFLKSWAAFHRSGGNLSDAPEAPVYARGTLLEPEEEKKVFAEEWKELVLVIQARLEKMRSTLADHGRTVRATFALDHFQIERIRDRIMSITGGRPSAFVAACSHVWICLTKARGHEDRTVYLSFPADCRTRVEPPVPDAYFGNLICVVICEAAGAELAGPGGLVTASEVIHAGIRSLDGRVVAGQREAARKISMRVGERILAVVGSPRLRVYETDFGWGPPKKVELVSIGEGGDISLGDSRGGEGGLEIGMAGPISEIELFGRLLKADLGTY